MREATIFELSSPGRTGVTFPKSDVPAFDLPDESLLRDDLPLPELAEVDVVRHYMPFRATTTASIPASTRSARAR
jgi:glycine dehydrogenase subunit 2